MNWNKYQAKASAEEVNQYLDFLIVPSFQGVKSLFVLSSENEGDRKVHTGYYLPKREIKDYNVMIDGKKLFWSDGSEWYWNTFQQGKEMIIQLIFC